MSEQTDNSHGIIKEETMEKRERSGLYLFMSILLLAMLFTGCDLLGSGDDNSEFTLVRTPQNLLFIQESDYSAFSGTPETYMEFAPPEDIGATSYTLQQSLDGGTSWNNFQYYGEDLTTTSEISDNFDINLGNDSLIRLAITGGEYDGMYSNEVEVVLSTVSTWFQGWSISPGGFYEYIDAYSAGKTTESSFTVWKTSDNSVVEDALTYQWYRLNPDDFELMTPITGATGASYTSTSADSGYILVIRATGDGVNAGGYCQLLGPYIT